MIAEAHYRALVDVLLTPKVQVTFRWMKAQGTKNHKHKEKAEETENPFYTLEWIHRSGSRIFFSTESSKR